MTHLVFGYHKLCDQCRGTGRKHYVNKLGHRVRYREWVPTTNKRQQGYWLDFPCTRCDGSGVVNV